LGVKIDAEPELMEQALNEIGICFLFAPRYHAAVRHVMPVRKALGVRTIFNLLGPLANPAGATSQLLGVYAPELTEMFAHALRLLGTRRAFVVHGHDGMDELTICDATRVSELNNGTVKTYDLAPERFFGERATPADVAGGDAAANAAILTAVLQGEPGARRNLVLLNAAAALVAAARRSAAACTSLLWLSTTACSALFLSRYSCDAGGGGGAAGSACVSMGCG
jgi:anthranilate phosphoribosyltransferase